MTKTEITLSDPQADYLLVGLRITTMLPDGASCQHLSIESPLKDWAIFDDDVEAVEAIIWRKRFILESLSESQRALISDSYNSSTWYEQQLKTAGNRGGMNLGLELSRINTVPKRLGIKLQKLGFNVKPYSPN